MKIKSLLLISFLFIAFCESNFKPAGLKLKQSQAERVTVFKETQTPQKLSDWGMLFINDGQLNLRMDAVPYHLNTPLFSDYAHKFRSIWIPTSSGSDNIEKKIGIDSKGDLIFPVGSILSKTFYYPRDGFTNGTLTAVQNDKVHSSGSSIDLNKNHLIETRLLIKQQGGWQALPYVWNSEQTEAILEITGGSLPVKLKSESGTKKFTYIVPDANQCKGCHISNHTSGELKPIGPKFRHLNLTYDYQPEISSNQIKHLKQLGMITQTTEYDKFTIDKRFVNTDWRARNKNINNAARSYLDINCSHCHNPDGPADTSALYLNRSNLDRAHLGYCKPPVAAGKGSGNREFDILPGHADESIITFRMQSIDPSIVMPELGRSIMHKEGVELIRKWINGLEGDCKQKPASS